MRSQFWELLNLYTFRNIYFRKYEDRVCRINNAIVALCILATTSSVASWWVWGQFPLMWSLIIIASQIAQTLSPFFPYTKQKISLRFIIQEMGPLLNDMEHEWNNIDIRGYDDDKIEKLLKTFRNRYSSLETKYTGNVRFPASDAIRIRAEEERDYSIQRLCRRG